jgi:phage-related protein
VTITAKDHTRYIASRMENMAGGVFSEVIMRVVNTDRLDRPAEVEHTFQVISSSVQNYIVNFTLGAENPLSIRFPRHMQFRDRCAWRFKGYGCAYAGAAGSCDYTKDGANGCRVKGNTINFRGLPGLVRLAI